MTTTTLPNTQLCRDDNPGFIIATIAFDPNRFGAIRTSLGQTLRLPAAVASTSAKQIVASGTLSWAGEQDGIAIPAQPIILNENFLSVPITDEQIARLEEKRAGGVAIFELRIRALATIEKSPAILVASHPATIVVGRDEWIKILEMLGWGTRRLIELPAFPKKHDPLWDEIGERLWAASQRMADSDPGAASTEARVALERTIEAVGSVLGINRAGSPLKPFGEKVVAELEKRHTPKSGDQYQVLADSIRLAVSTFGFSSAGAHGGFDVVERANAELSIAVAAALYVFAARSV